MAKRKLVKTPTKVMWSEDPYLAPGRTHKVAPGVKTRTGKLPSGVDYNVQKQKRTQTTSSATGKEGSYTRIKRPKGNITGVVRKDEFTPAYGTRGKWKRKTVLNSGEVRIEGDAKKKSTKRR